MTEQENQIIETDEEDNGSLLDGLRRILMAGIGVAVLAQEEIEDFVSRLVDRGEIAENDGHTLVNDILERRVQVIQNNTRKVSDGVDRGVESIFNLLNIPSRSEILALSEQIDELSKKVDALREME